MIIFQNYFENVQYSLPSHAYRGVGGRGGEFTETMRIRKFVVLQVGKDGKGEKDGKVIE
jgi:hypothetical protein